MNTSSDEQVSMPQATIVVDDCASRIVDPERVASVRTAVPDAGTVQALADVFALLGDPRRLALMVALLEAGELCVCDLAAVTGMSESATSHALRLLRAHGVVRFRRSGRMAYYALTDGHVRMLLDVALQHLGHGDA